jgi:hypothetical protein
MSFRVATDRSRGRLRRLRRALAVILTNAAKLGRDVRLAESGCVALDPWFFDKLPGGLPMTAEGVSLATPENNPARAETDRGLDTSANPGSFPGVASDAPSDHRDLCSPGGQADR